MAETIIIKRCSKCKITKSISEFHKDAKSKDGYHGYCKKCMSKHNAKYKQTEQGKVANKHYDQSKKGKIAHLKALRHYWNSHSEYRRATSAVSHAIRDGKLPRLEILKCHYCHEQAEQYHHHLGYEPEHFLNVVSVCRSCHSFIHRDTYSRVVLRRQAITSAGALR